MCNVGSGGNDGVVFTDPYLARPSLISENASRGWAMTSTLAGTFVSSALLLPSFTTSVTASGNQEAADGVVWLDVASVTGLAVLRVETECSWED